MSKGCAAFSTTNARYCFGDKSVLRPVSYHHYLAAHLTFPFEAKWEPEYGPSATIKITGLSDPKGEPGIEEMYGLFCEARAD